MGSVFFLARVLERDVQANTALGWRDDGRRYWIESCREYGAILQWDGENPPPTERSL